MIKSNVLPFRRPGSASVGFGTQALADAARHKALRCAILACLRDARVVTAVDKAIKDGRA